MTTPGTQTSGLGTSFVRTLVPIVIGPVIARIMPGVDPHDPNVLLVVSAIASYVYYVVVRLLELKAPQVGYLLGIAKAPAYSSAPSPSPDTGEHVEAVVVPDTKTCDVCGTSWTAPPEDCPEGPHEDPQPVDDPAEGDDMDLPPMDDPVEPEVGLEDVPLSLVAPVAPKKRAPRKTQP